MREPPRDAATKLAIDRTFLAHERTLMAWIRTAASLISFGFGTYKFFQYLGQTPAAPTPPTRLGPREFAIVMIGIGIVSLVVAIAQQRVAMKALEEEYGVHRTSQALIICVAVAIAGTALLVMAFVRA